MSKRAFHRALHAVPGAEAAWISLNRMVGRWPGPSFSGWGMTTETLPPWFNGGGDHLVKQFGVIQADLLERVRTNQFHLSQFDDAPDKAKVLRELMWRHYLVCWSVRFAAAATAPAVKTLVECGVCDGLTAYFAMRALHLEGHPFKTVLYDAWEGMKTPYLLGSEQAAAGSYSYLALDSTKNNLRDFQRETTFVKGFIPETFASSPLPSDVVWLHIDLNSAIPTAAALDTLYDRMPPGAVILFDDYGWRAYQDTKAVVENFAAGRKGLLLPVPTGQAIFFKQA